MTSARNELAMMTLARLCGLEVPETRPVHRDVIADVPERLWPSGEEHAYAVRRFDRASTGRIHMEDLAQVRGVYPGAKYEGNFETVARLIYRGVDMASLREFVRRLAFNVIIRNGDAHLKNGSLLYLDPRQLSLSPAYDLVSMLPYEDSPKARNLGLKLMSSRQYERVRLSTFGALQKRLGITASQADFAADARAVAGAIEEHWDAVRGAHLHDSKLGAQLSEVLNVSLRRIDSSS